MEFLNKNEERIKQINAFMQALNQKDTNKVEVYERYKDAIKDVHPIDLFYVQMYHEDSKLSEKTIKETANKFVNVFHEGLARFEFKEHHHPFMQWFLEENEAIINHLKSLKPYFKEHQMINHQKTLKKGFIKCLEFEKKWVKKENILFPRLEDKVPSTKPLKVMWSLHDDARKQIKKIIHHFESETLDVDKVKPIIGSYYYLIYGIIQKEVLILLPVADKFLTDDLLDTMLKESMQYGYVFMEKYIEESKKSLDDHAFTEGLYKVKNGSLSFKELTLMLNHLPQDITFVDKHDKVKYFNETKTRHFPRNPSIIGRLVQHCHPPKSVDTVIEIVDAFKQGRKDVAEFWITFKERFLYITYYAVRDEAGNYEGVLEVSQDVTHIRNLQGERRLLEWD
ncbi:MAG: PAS domain-containing protein [Candidatus Izemoplasmataceae bacterium]